MPEQELVTPAQSDQFVLIASLLIAVIGAVWGYRSIGGRGLLAGLCGPLMLGLWRFHEYITRYDPGHDPVTGKYDPSREYFGLDKVKVLLFEVVLFVVIGVALGWAWNVMCRTRMSRRDAESAEI